MIERTHRTTLGLAVVVAALWSWSCAGEPEGEATGLLASKLVGVDTYLYFRCNSTGWGVDEKTRLRPTRDPYLFTIAYDVTAPWMLPGMGFDDCALTETNQFNGWGSNQTHYTYGSYPANVVSAPAGGRVTSTGPNPRNFRVQYPALGRYEITVNWRQGTFSIDSVVESCADLYPGFNDRADPLRFNLVFLGAGFADDNELEWALRRLVDREGIGLAQAGANGLMQIPLLRDQSNRFNFLYVTGTRPFSSRYPTSDEVRNQLLPEARVVPCQNVLPNRVLPIFIYPQLPEPTASDPNSYPYGSFGRYSAIVGDCSVRERDWNLPCNPGALKGALHEMLHSFPCLGDEYQSVEAGVRFVGPLNDNEAALQFWQGDDYVQCTQQAPWHDLIGNGCGAPGVVDCYKPECIDFSVSPPRFNISFDYSEFRTDCCLPEHPDCFREVVCFQGGLYADLGIFRSTAGSLIRSHYFEFEDFPAAAYLSPVHEEQVLRILAKGPAIGRRWPPYDFGLDCNFTRPDFSD